MLYTEKYEAIRQSEAVKQPHMLLKKKRAKQCCVERALPEGRKRNRR